DPRTLPGRPGHRGGKRDRARNRREARQKRRAGRRQRPERRGRRRGRRPDKGLGRGSGSGSRRRLRSGSSRTDYGHGSRRLWLPGDPRQQRRLSAAEAVRGSHGRRLRPDDRRAPARYVPMHPRRAARDALAGWRHRGQRRLPARPDRRHRALSLQRRQGWDHRPHQVPGPGGVGAGRQGERGRPRTHQHRAHPRPLRGVAAGQGRRATPRALRRAGGGGRDGRLPGFGRGYALRRTDARPQLGRRDAV
ncbi:3-oxoacyl-[acyl-carrier protein] reductase, partial [uncultured Rubrobacteraceae bacterium]